MHCVICRKTGHRGSSCPLSGLCRRCLQTGHMSRECRQAWGIILPGTEVLHSSAPAAEDDTCADYTPLPEEASSEASEVEEDNEILSGDDQFVASAAPSSSPSPVAASGVPVPVSGVPASDVAPALRVPAAVPSVVPASPVPPAPVSYVPSSVPVQDIPVSSAASVPPAVSSVTTVSSTHRDKIDPVLLSA